MSSREFERHATRFEMLETARHVQMQNHVVEGLRQFRSHDA
jgi:hypothetical protein